MFKSKKVKGLPSGYKGWWYSGKKATVHIVFPSITIRVPIGNHGATLNVPYQHEQLNLDLAK